MKPLSACVGAFSILLGITPLVALADQPNTRKAIGILLAAGDISTCGNEKWHLYANKTAEIIRKVIRESKAAEPSIPVYVLALGDLAYENGTAEQFKCFQERWSGFDDVLLPVPGNHEYESPHAAPYFNHFKNNLFVNQNGEKKGYFALNFPRKEGPWRLIGLNSQIEGKAAMKTQMEWLKNQLDITNEANTQECVLAFWHTPTFSSGQHGHGYKKAPETTLIKERPMQAALRILYRHGASAVVTGHDHNYEQFSPHDPNGLPFQDGIRSFVSGTGGSILTFDIYNSMAPNSEGLYGRTKGVQGVLKFELFENQYKWEFLPIDKKKKFQLKTTVADCRDRRKPAG